MHAICSCKHVTQSDSMDFKFFFSMRSENAKQLTCQSNIIFISIVLV